MSAYLLSIVSWIQVHPSYVLLQKGGITMVPLILSLLLAFSITLERWIFLTLLCQKKHQDWFDKALKQLKTHNIASAYSLIPKDDLSPYEILYQTALENWYSSSKVFDISMQNTAEHLIPKLEKKIDTLDVIITAAPLIGLLGTILGMISTFKLLDHADQQSFSISSGIAEALIATATGLVVALLCLFAYHALRNKVRKVIANMEYFASKCQMIHLAREDATHNPLKPLEKTLSQ
jgi:biopolymer transport protein ExbB